MLRKKTVHLPKALEAVGVVATVVVAVVVVVVVMDDVTEPIICVTKAAQLRTGVYEAMSWRPKSELTKASTASFGLIRG